jgi:RNA polymerase sigma factor (sigma-70 family)
MPRDSLRSVLHYLHRVASDGPAAISDAELLERFAQRRDEAAFELLVWRHGPMVLALCQRLLHQEQDAEDAFQATFLTLVRKAGSIQKKESLASWLYKVAYRIACRVRSRKPVPAQSAMTEQPAPPTEMEAVWRDLRTVLDQELAGLPESSRRPIVLCYLEGKTHEEAARMLGCPTGTVAARLSRARERLRLRLTRRGWTLSAPLLAAVLADKAVASAITPELVHHTVQSALVYATGKSAASVLSLKAVALTEGVLRMMWLSKLRIVAAMFLAVALVGAGIGLAVWESWAGEAPGPNPVTRAVPPAAQAKAQTPAGQAEGDAKAEVVKLRDELAKLRADLDSALSEIKTLKNALRQGGVPPQQGPLYKGKPSQFWLQQAEDGDIEFRTEAIKALGVLAQKDKKLLPVLFAALMDSSNGAGEEAAYALATMGADIVPKLVDVLKEKSSAVAHARAALALRQLGPDAKPAVPALIDALKDEALQVRSYAANALGSIGPAAKPAIPVLLDTLESFVKEMQTEAKKQVKKLGDKRIGGKQKGTPRGPADFAFKGRQRSLSARSIIDILVQIDPEVRDVLSDVHLGESIPFPDPPSIAEEWQRGLDSLRQRYKKQ